MAVCPACGKELPTGEFPFCPFCTSPLSEPAPASREQRKTVTVLFCDVTGSTSLGESTDPEAVRALLARFFERMKGIVEAHGGMVEKFIGDAVMAVYGVPQVHEDDALRAVRASVEMRDALPELGVQARIGVNTGEVVTGTEERLATGDAVNVAARLEQAAAPGEILIGEETLRLVRDAVSCEPMEPLELKGKAAPVPAFRLVEVTGELQRRHEAPMVGRTRELDRLRDAFGQAVENRSCQLFTVLGAAGVGKSRLAAEFLGGIDAAVVRGRCLPYGEGITYWPVVEVIKQLPEQQLDPAAQQALHSVLGEHASASSDEIAWAFRKLLEAAASEQPLVVVFDDIHWGEETFLDLVEHVADLSREVPILLLCMARPELLDRRAAWAGGKLNATNVLLEPLSTDETESLIGELAGGLPDDIRQRVVVAAEGNPLFVEEMVELARESGDGNIAVPPTIQALLAARIDQLDPSERGVLERGAVEGRVFHRGAVQALAPEESQVTTRLSSLVRKELVRPDTPQLPGEDAFRFRHLLIRDAAYDALPKAERADLHERFALWLEEYGADLVELDEILGYHLDQAVRYRKELGEPVGEDLAAEARKHLAAAADRARLRNDHSAAITLFERVLALVPAPEIDLVAEVELASALFWGGRGDDAMIRAVAAAEQAASAGDRVAELCLRVLEWTFRTFIDPEGATDKLEALTEEAIPIFEAAENDFALYAAYYGRGQAANMRAQADVAVDAYTRAQEHAEKTGSPRPLIGWIATFLVIGSKPVAEVLEWLEEQKATTGETIHFDRHRARALAMLGRFEEAREVLAHERAELLDRGHTGGLASLLGFEGIEVELLAGDAKAGVEAGLEGARVMEEEGARSALSSVAGVLARALCAAGRFDEAYGWTERADELGAVDDLLTQFLWRQARAMVLAQRGEQEEAERLAREAIEIVEQTDYLDRQADVYADYGDVLELCGKDPRPALEEALARYERKGNVVMAERTRERLAELIA